MTRPAPMKTTQQSKASASTVRLRRSPSRAPPDVGPAAPARLRIGERLCQDRLQPSLMVGAANDPYEVEADKTAAQVMSMPEPTQGEHETSAPTALSPPQTAARDSIQKTEDISLKLRREGLGGQPSLDEFDSSPAAPADQQEPTIEATEDVKLDKLDSGDLDELDSGVIAGEDGGSDSSDGGGAGIQAKSIEVGAEGGAAPPDISRRVANPSNGRPLPEGVRSFMEPRFGADFSSVRIHDQSNDRSTARRLGARAFTHRDRIWIGDSETAENKTLMAHELTHVVQQHPSVRSPAKSPAVSRDILTISSAPIRAQRGVRSWIADHANDIPGFRLLTVILGRNPITSKKVDRNAINLIGGLMSLVPGGNQIYQNLVESRVIQEAYDWVKGALEEHNISLARVRQTLGDVIDNFEYLHPISSVIRTVTPLVRDIKNFGIAALAKLKEVVIRGALRLAGSLGDRIWGIIQKTGNTIFMILGNPAGFAVNLLKSVIEGFRLFKNNAVEHLKQGLMGWLFGTMQGLNIQLPAKLDFKGMMSIAFQILGLTYQKLRTILVARLKPSGERKVRLIEKAVSFVKLLITEGFAGVWSKMLEYIDNFKQTVIEGIKTWVRNAIIGQAIQWAISLSNPVGGIIKIVLAIYKVIKAFIERLEQIAAFANSVFDSIGRIARGQIGEAARFIEQALARTVPLIFSFLAAVLGVPSIVGTIRGIITRLQAKVKAAISKVIDFVLKKIKKLWSKLLGKLNRKRSLPRAPFMVGQKVHELYAKKEGRQVKMKVASAKPGADAATAPPDVEKVRGEIKGSPDTEAKVAEFQTVLSEATHTTITSAKKVKAENKTGSSRAPTTKLQAQLNEHAAKLSEKGVVLHNLPGIETDIEVGLIRAASARNPNEGFVGAYSEVKAKAKEGKPDNGGPAKGNAAGVTAEQYDADHLLEDSFISKVYSGLTSKGDLKGDGADGGSDGGSAKNETFVRADPDGTAPKVGAGQAIAKPDYGKLAERGADPNQMLSILLYQPVHNSKSISTTKRRKDRNAKLDAALALPTPLERQAKIKALLLVQLDLETAEVKTAFNMTDNATPEDVKTFLTAKLLEIKTRNTTDYALQAGGGAPAPEPKALSADGRRSVQTFSNYLVEGVGGPYGPLTKLPGKYKTSHLIADHIVDKVMPLTAQTMTFASLPAVSKIPIGLPRRADENQQKRGARTRRYNIAAKESVFANTSPMISYSEKSGGAVILYSTIDRAGRASALNNTKSLLAKQISPDHVKALAKHVEDGGSKEAAIKDSRTKIHGMWKKAFMGQFTQHADLVTGAYSTDRANVERLNADSNPAKALAKFDALVNRVKSTLGILKGQTSDLFKG